MHFTMCECLCVSRTDHDRTRCRCADLGCDERRTLFAPTEGPLYEARRSLIADLSQVRDRTGSQRGGGWTGMVDSVVGGGWWGGGAVSGWVGGGMVVVVWREGVWGCGWVLRHRMRVGVGVPCPRPCARSNRRCAAQPPNVIDHKMPRMVRCRPPPLAFSPPQPLTLSAISLHSPLSVLAPPKDLQPCMRRTFVPVPDACCRSPRACVFTTPASRLRSANASR